MADYPLYSWLLLYCLYLFTFINLNFFTMKNNYETPMIEVLDVAIEQGIATTGTPGMDGMPKLPW